MRHFCDGVYVLHAARLAGHIEAKLARKIMVVEPKLKEEARDKG
jgi:hypothetical protein